MKSLEIEHPENVNVNIKMTPPMTKIAHEKQRLAFEDKEAIASLTDTKFTDIAVVNSYLDVN